MGTWSFSVEILAGAWRLPPTPSSAEVKERVELYPYSFVPLDNPPEEAYGYASGREHQ